MFTKTSPRKQKNSKVDEGYSSMVEHATYNQEVPGSNPYSLDEAAKAGSGYDLCKR